MLIVLPVGIRSSRALRRLSVHSLPSNSLHHTPPPFAVTHRLFILDCCYTRLHLLQRSPMERDEDTDSAKRGRNLYKNW